MSPLSDERAQTELARAEMKCRVEERSTRTEPARDE
jgi:hypothetical protein